MLFSKVKLYNTNISFVIITIIGGGSPPLPYNVTDLKCEQSLIHGHTPSPRERVALCSNNRWWGPTQRLPLYDVHMQGSYGVDKPFRITQPSIS